MEVLFDKALVHKKNQLNELRNSGDWTFQELRLFNIYLSKINNEDKSTRFVTFPLSDFVELMEIKKVNLNAIRQAVKQLFSKVVEVPIGDKKGYDWFPLFSNCSLINENNDWYIVMEAHEKALPLMFDYKREFFTYAIKNIIPLKSPIQIRMYEIIRQYEKLGKVTYSIEKIRELIGIKPNEYPTFSEFKRRVLEPCKKIISENTDIQYEYECAERGASGKWLSIKFTITKKTSYIKKSSNKADINEEVINTTCADSETTADYDTDWNEFYGNKELACLAEACEYEFSKIEMEILENLICKIYIEEESVTKSLLMGRYFWLADRYKLLCREAEKKKEKGEIISDRFKYFVSMIKNENGL